MRFKNFDLNLLVLLDVILWEQNITRAAEKLSMSQSAASGALARLREHFDDPLIVAVGRTMQLTPRGQELIEPVRRFLIQAESTIERKPAFVSEDSDRRFVIYASDYVISVLLIPAIREINALAPGVSFELRMINAGALESIRNGECDLAIAPQNFAIQNQPRKKIFDDKYCVIACKNNSLLTNATLSVEQYLEAGHVIYSSANSLSIESVYMNLKCLDRKVSVLVESFNLLPQFVVGTNRIATVHSRLAKLWMQRWPIQMLELPLDCPGISEVIQWPVLKKDDPALHWLIDALIKVANSDE